MLVLKKKLETKFFFVGNKNYWKTSCGGVGAKWHPVHKVSEQLHDNQSWVIHDTYRQRPFATLPGIVKATSKLVLAFLKALFLKTAWNFNFVFCFPSHKTWTLWCVQMFYIHVPNDCSSIGDVSLGLKLHVDWWVMAPKHIMVSPKHLEIIFSPVTPFHPRSETESQGLTHPTHSSTSATRLTFTWQLFNFSF